VFHEKYLCFLYNYGTHLTLVQHTDRAVQFALRYWLDGNTNDDLAAMHLLEQACRAGRTYRILLGDSYGTCDNLRDLESALRAASAVASSTASVGTAPPEEDPIPP